MRPITIVHYFNGRPLSAFGNIDFIETYGFILFCINLTNAIVHMNLYFYGINIGSVHVDFYYDLSFYSYTLGIPLLSSLIVDTKQSFHGSLLNNYIIVLDMFGQPHLEDVHPGTLVLPEFINPDLTFHISIY